MSHDSRCACHVGATCGEPEPQVDRCKDHSCAKPCPFGCHGPYASVEKPLSAIAAMAVDLGDPNLSSTFRKPQREENEIIGERIDELSDESLYMIARAAQQTGYPMMQWPSILRETLKDILCDSMIRCSSCKALRPASWEYCGCGAGRNWKKPHRKCKSFRGKNCRLSVNHEGECLY